jgi:Fe-S-cluster containining protein
MSAARRQAGSARQIMSDYTAGLRRGLVSVPCDGCTACCRSLIVELNEAEAARMPHVRLDDGRLALDKRPDGACVFLGDTGCSIHEQWRPRACRVFDCRFALLIGQRWNSPAMEEAVASWEFEEPTPEEGNILAAMRRAFAEAGGAMDMAKAFQRAARRLNAGER